MSGNKVQAHVNTDHEASGRTSMPMTSVIPERDPEFYFDDSLVVIRVENTLFKVHRYHLIKSETFLNMFKMPKGPSEVLEEGASPEHPIVLSGVKSSDFRALLKVLYTIHYPNLSPNYDPDIIVPAFRLAHMWNFPDLRDHLLPLVRDSIESVDKIVLADTDQVSSSKVSAHTTQVATERHPEFYFDDRHVVIQVEDTLFRVHTYQLLKSDTFSDMFKLPNSPGEVLEEGASPEHPIILKEVKSSDFAALLQVLYAVYFTNERPKCHQEIIVPAFRLAQMWNFSDLRAHLFPLVTDALGCVDKIVLGRELGIQEWLVPAHMELCQRTESLTITEVKKLGIDSTVMIFRLRERSRPSRSVPNTECVWTYCHSCGTSPLMLGNHADDGDCCKCGCHVSSGTRHYRFLATPSSTAPNSGRAWTFCFSCANVSPVYRNHRAAGNCQQCGTNISSSTTHFRFTTSSTTPPCSNTEIESQLKKWVQGGCVTE